MFKLIILLLQISIAILPHGQAANILALYPTPSPSHLIIEMAIVKALAERNHNLTVITTLPIQSNSQVPGITHIKLESGQMSMTQLMKEIQGTGMQRILKFGIVLQKLVNSTAEILKDEQFQSFLQNEGNKFDLMLLGNIQTDFLYGIAVHFNCPIINIFPNQPTPSMLRDIGNPLEASYVPFSFVETGNVGDFMFRVKNLGVMLFQLFTAWSLEPLLKDIYE